MSERGVTERRVPLFVWLVTAFHIAMMLAFTLLYPPFTGFDETQHVDAVMSIRYDHAWPGPGHRVFSKGVLLAATPVVQAESHQPFSDDPLPPESQRPSLVALGVHDKALDYPLPNQMTQHPPGYYALAAGWLAVVPGSSGWSYDRTVQWLRLLSVLLFSPLCLIAWAFARTLRGSPSVARLAAVLPLLSPQLERVGSAVNNDSLTVLTTALALLLVARVVQGDFRTRTGVLLGAITGISLLSKGFALALVPAVGLAYLVSRRKTATWWRTGLLSLTVAFGVGGWWYVRNLLEFGAVQPQGIPDFNSRVLGHASPPGTPLSHLTFLEGAYTRVSVRFWGSLGISYARPEAYPSLMTNVFVLVVAAALALVVLRRWRSAGPAVLVAVLVPLAIMIVIVLAGIYDGYRWNRSFPGAQGRYLFGLIAAVSAAVAVGLGTVLRERVLRWVVPGVVLLVMAIDAIGVRYLLRQQWLPKPGYPGSRLHAALDGIKRYSSWPGFVTPTVFCLVAGLGLGLVVCAFLKKADLEVPAGQNGLDPTPAL